jgi:hypothetical protein
VALDLLNNLDNSPKLKGGNPMAQLSSKRFHVTDGSGFERVIQNSIAPGKLLKLREGVYKQLKDRDWLFNKFENDTVFLIHASRAYGIAVRTGDIDWEVTGLSRPKDQPDKAWKSTRGSR